MMRAGKVGIALSAGAPVRTRVEALFRRSLDRTTMLVNAQSVWDEFERAGGFPEMDLRADLEDVTPPFPALWIEFQVRAVSRRVGCLIQRTDATESDARAAKTSGETFTDGPYKHFVRLDFFMETQGMSAYAGWLHLLTDEFGQIAWNNGQSSYLNEDSDARQGVFARWLMTVAEAIVRMNTQGTVLVPIGDGRRLGRRRPLSAPACVWHEIVINPERVVKQGEGVSTFSGDAADRREHWVRAHRKDYRKGGGLFGRTKALVWVPEHKKGNPELGCEIPEFRIGRSV